MQTRLKPPRTGSLETDRVLKDAFVKIEKAANHASKKPRTVTENYTTTAEDYLIFCNGTLTVTLRRANMGDLIILKNIGSGTVTVAASGSDTVEDTSIAAGESVWYRSDGDSNWYAVAGY